MKTIRRFLIENGEKIETNYNKPSIKCLIKYDGKILVLRRSAGTPGAGNWDLPGGMIEKGENEIDALRREVREETNLKITPPKFVATIDMGHGRGKSKAKTKIYVAKPYGRNDVALLPSPNFQNFQDKPKPEHSEFKWVQYQDELERMPLIKDLLELLLKHVEKRDNP